MEVYCLINNIKILGELSCGDIEKTSREFNADS